uniref:Uncharacterized protein n=1 Tax=Anguilla anguilla TaxID=7936 RepID=A0A0E9R0I1_ANGAN
MSHIFLLHAGNVYIPAHILIINILILLGLDPYCSISFLCK